MKTNHFSKHREVLQHNRYGYTKAVDLWSLGCITVVLLAGELPLQHLTGTYTYPTELAQIKDDLDQSLYNNIGWDKAGKCAKDFICRLLMPDESKRMNVKQALNHYWFTNPIYKKQLESLYERSVRDWKPRMHRGHLIVDLDDLETSGNAPIPTSENLQESQHQLQSQSQSQLQPSNHDNDNDNDNNNINNRIQTRYSTTLSDPILPELYRQSSNATMNEFQLRPMPMTMAMRKGKNSTSTYATHVHNPSINSYHGINTISNDKENSNQEPDSEILIMNNFNFNSHTDYYDTYAYESQTPATAVNES